MSHRLAITQVWFNKSGKPDQVVPLGDLDGAGLNAMRLLEDHFEGLYWSAPSSDHKIRFHRWAACAQPHTVAAIFKAGEGGIEADLFEEDLQTPAGTRTAEMYEAPLVVALLHLPGGADRGWMVTHAFYNRYFKAGLLRSIHETVGHQVRILEPKLKLNMESWAPLGDLQQIIESGQVTGFALQDPSDVDAFTPGGMMPDTIGNARLVVTPTRGHRFPKKPFLDAVANDDDRLELLTVGGKSWGEGVVDVDTPTGSRKFVLGEDNKEWFSWDVTEQVGKGQPTDEDLVEAAVKLLKDTGRMH